MRYLTRIVFENWLCYSSVDIELGPKVYAVVARHARDPERSNWLGKSAFVGGVKFGIDGDHDARTENGWIRRGQRSGQVQLHFDDGTVITRMRISGKSTQLTLLRPGHKAARGEEAQRLIDEAIGLSKTDRDATCFLEQGMMARLMTMAPSKRLEVVGSWFRLDRVRECLDDVGAACADLSWRAQAVAGNLRVVRDTFARALEGYESEEALRGAADAQRAAVEAAEGRLATAQAELAAVAERAEAGRVIADYERVEREGRALRQEADALGAIEELQAEQRAASKALAEALGAKSRARDEVERRREVAGGRFDGACPVADIECPATALINSKRVASGKALRAAEEALKAASFVASDASKAETQAMARLQAAERKHERLRGLREELKRLRPGYVTGMKAGRPGDPSALREQVASLVRAIADARGKLGSLERSLDLMARAREEERALALKLEALEAELATRREAVQFFKALQRRVAERSLAQVEDGMNAVLGDSGIDLGARLVWSREGEGSAKTCERCGHPFPKSERVKECERCGAPRGANIIDRLEPVLTNRSGGALDLAGLALQLSASRWLRDDRASPWSCAFLDEPFGQLDAANRRALSAHISGMLSSRYGFAQAFLIAHHASVLDALPGRIEITAEGSREDVVSTARVVA